MQTEMLDTFFLARPLDGMMPTEKLDMFLSVHVYNWLRITFVDRMTSYKNIVESRVLKTVNRILVSFDDFLNSTVCTLHKTIIGTLTGWIHVVNLRRTCLKVLREDGYHLAWN